MKRLFLHLRTSHSLKLSEHIHGASDQVHADGTELHMRRQRAGNKVAVL